MLKITVPGDEAFDELNLEFTTQGDVVLELEHSLVSLSKWESIFEKPFLGNDDRTTEEMVGYVKAMTLTPEVPDAVFDKLSAENIAVINEYISAKMTATWFADEPGAPKTNQVITAELIYYWMTVFQIPFECEHWHLNRLFTLIRVCNIKSAKPKKMGRAEQAARNRELNAMRKKQLGTKG